ncbi:MAG TPA: pyridoxal-phosphate dependent enzyme, partial [bacterium]|nr:pyridoxal-phosphate dependent enzyme [bacterium]
MNADFGIKWFLNREGAVCADNPAIEAYVPMESVRLARKFHRQIPGYRVSPLKGLDNLAARFGLGGIWVKDESQRLTLNSFKVLGGSFAVYRFLLDRLGMSGSEVTFAELTSPENRRRLGDLTFAAATDGNHGRGIAWAATKLGFPSIVYVHKGTSKARIAAIEANGAEVRVVDGTYDDAVRQVSADAAVRGWQVISDTSWPGYRDIP